MGIDSDDIEGRLVELETKIVCGQIGRGAYQDPAFGFLDDVVHDVTAGDGFASSPRALK